MRLRLISNVFLILPAFLSAAPVWADAIVMTRAMSASTIVELFIEDDGIRLELEIGLSDLEGFRNLLPDESTQANFTCVARFEPLRHGFTPF